MEKIDLALFTWNHKNRNKCVEEVSFLFMDVEYAKPEIIPNLLLLDALLDVSS